MVNQRLLISFLIATMPLTYALKAIFNWNMVWLDPSLIIGVFLFGYLVITHQFELKAKQDLFCLFFLGFTLLSLIIGLYHFPANAPHLSLYSMFNLYIKLIIMVIYFRTLQQLLQTQSVQQLIMTVLSWTVIVELCIAAVFFLQSIGIIHIFTGAPGAYLYKYSLRQNIVLFGLSIVRWGGTFIESPIFGLFMWCSFLTLFCYYKKNIENGDINEKTIKLGLICSALGALLSLATEIYISILLFSLFSLYQIIKNRRYAKKYLFNNIGGLLLLILCFVGLTGQLTSRIESATNTNKVIHYEITQNIQKSKQNNNTAHNAANDFLENDQNNNSMITASGNMGNSIGERKTILNFTIDTMLHNGSLFFLTGSGIGLFGSYLSARYPFYPPTTTAQLLPIDWWFQYGTIGLFIFIFALYFFSKQALNNYGKFGIIVLLSIILAIFTQASWMWESPFLLIALLTTNPTKKLNNDLT